MKHWLGLGCKACNAYGFDLLGRLRVDTPVPRDNI